MRKEKLYSPLLDTISYCFSLVSRPKSSPSCKLNRVGNKGYRTVAPSHLNPTCMVALGGRCNPLWWKHARTALRRGRVKVVSCGVPTREPWSAYIAVPLLGEIGNIHCRTIAYRFVRVRRKGPWSERIGNARNSVTEVALSVLAKCSCVRQTICYRSHRQKCVGNHWSIRSWKTKVGVSSDSRGNAVCNS